MNAPQWGEFLHLLVGPLSATVAGVIISVLIEYWGAFQNLAPKWKTAVYVLLCEAVPLLATAAAIATGEFGAWGDIQTTWWPAVYAGFTAAGVGTLIHTWKPDAFKSSGFSRSGG